MEIDYDYLKQLLEAFAAAPKPTTDIFDLKTRGIDYEADQFLFHIGNLQNKELVQQPDGSSDVGVSYSGEGQPTWSVLPLRLTAAGHELRDGMRSERAMAVIKRDFKHAGIDTAKTIFKVMLEESIKTATKAFVGCGPGEHRAFDHHLRRAGSLTKQTPYERPGAGGAIEFAPHSP